MNVHHAARGFDRAADVYDRVRPDYPAETLRWLADVLDLRDGRAVLDLAAGTGKLTAPLLSTGARVIAVEPSEEMLALLRRAAPSAEALRGTAEEIPLAGASVDAVTVAQAFHWFANEAALGEIHRVLRPGGTLALVWNRRDLTAPAHAALEELMAAKVGDTPRHRDPDWNRVIEQSPLFDPLAAAEQPNVQRLPPGGLVERAASTSFIAALPDAERRELLDEVARREAALPKPIEMPHVCELFAFRRRD
jgi:SAM-dependent methyltransferase